MKNFILLLVANIMVFAASAQQPVVPEILSAYYNIKDALVASDNKGASEHSSVFKTLVTTIDEKAFSEPEQKILQKTIPALTKQAAEISSSKSIEEQRKHFQLLSDNLFLLVESAKQRNEPVYQQYCPMKKAYWLSKEQSIKNPYYGKQMLNCGKVTKTLK